MKIYLVLGIGDIGSAIAHALHCDQFPVIIHDTALPTTTRRNMSFADAMFDGHATLEGINATRCSDYPTAIHILREESGIPVLAIDLEELVTYLQPDVIVDAQVHKRSDPQRLRGLASLTIGLGPGFSAGDNVDIAVESSWLGLGEIIRSGTTRALGGEPKPLAGVGRERYLYAPVAGIFRTSREIGEVVEAGELIARIDKTELSAPISGTLRGLTRNGVPVKVGTKIVEVDPRNEGANFAGIGERPAILAQAVRSLL